MGFLNIPSLELCTDLVLISVQKEDIEILMRSCLNAEEESECPSASDPPGNRERGKEPASFLWLPRLPWPKMLRLVCHTLPSKRCVRLRFSCRERSSISRFTLESALPFSSACQVHVSTVRGREEPVDASLGNPARPYPIRLMSLSFFTLPSTRPWFCARVRPATTAALSRSIP
jgi:hypothetical protein